MRRSRSYSLISAVPRPRALRRRQALIDKIAQELEIHSTIEEELFYPAVKNVRGGPSLVNEAESEHKKATPSLPRLRA
jgi:iron-sulfur cluster repair protein YtfE (RIC family)